MDANKSHLAAREAVPFGWRFTVPLLLGSTLNPINSSMLATGLVGIGLDFHKGPGETTSLISVLYLCSAIMQPTMGKFASIFGLRRIFLTGILILLLAGAVGAAAPDFALLLVSRALIGVGTSAAYPTAMALVRKRADSRGLGVPSRLLGNFSIAAQIAVVFGLPLGGILTGAFGWRALFAVNIPLAAITFIFTIRGVPKDAPIRSRGWWPLLAAIDIPGILLFAAAITSLLVFLGGLKSPDWWLVPLVVVLTTALLLWETRSASPLIDIRMMRKNFPLQRTYLRQMLVCLGIYSSLYGSSQWMGQSAHFTASAVGLILLPLSGLSIVIARVVSARAWLRWPLILSGVALSLSAAAMLLITSQSGTPALIGMSLLFGFSNGLSSYANQAALYAQTPAAEMATASGLYRTFAYMGAIFSASLIGITFGAAATDPGFHLLAWVLAATGIAIALLALFDRSIPVTTQ